MSATTISPPSERDVPRIEMPYRSPHAPPACFGIFEPRPMKCGPLIRGRNGRGVRREKVPREPRLLVVWPRLSEAVRCCNRWNAEVAREDALYFVAEVTVARVPNGLELRAAKEVSRD